MGLDYELVLVDRKSDSQKSSDYLKLNPAGRIPTLIDGEQPIFESAAICIHLCETHSEHNLMPALATKERPLFFQWLAYLNNTLQAELMIRIYPQKHTDDDASVPGIVSAQDVRIKAVLTIIDDALSDNRYLLGDQISACDYFLLMLTNWAMSIDQSPLAFDNLSRCLKHLSTLSTVKAVCEVECISLTTFGV